MMKNWHELNIISRCINSKKKKKETKKCNDKRKVWLKVKSELDNKMQKSEISYRNKKKSTIERRMQLRKEFK